MSHPLTTLTRTFATTTKPANMTLAEIDRLYNSIQRVITDRPTHVDLLALDQLAQTLDQVRRKRRLGLTGHVAGQLNFDGDEVAA